MSNSDFLDEVHTKASLYYSNSSLNGDRRSLSDFIESTLIGELGEHAIVDLCRRAGLESIHNDETITLEKSWDVLVEGLKGEIKFQGEGFDVAPKEFFSFSRASKDETMRQKWRSFDFITAFYVKQIGDQTFVVPWLLIDNEVINPELNLYVESQYNSGYFLKMNLSRKFYVQLNVEQRNFVL
jgi:hypothetical protein